MTTTKKSSGKRRAPATKRTAVNSKRGTQKSKLRSVRVPSPRSLRLERDQDRFMDTDVTHQSIYWIVFGIAVISLASWILKVQSDVQDIYDKIERNSYAIVETPPEHKNKQNDSNR